MKDVWSSETIANTAYTSVTSLQDLASIEPQKNDKPIVINGDLFGSNSASIAHTAREQLNLTAPLLYITRKRACDSGERLAFYDAGGDAIVDVQDIGPDEEHSQDPLLLKKKLAALVRRVRLHREGRLLSPVPGVTVSPFSRRFSVGGTVVPLTALEYKILEFVARQPVERVARYADFWEEVFDRRESLNLLHVMISRINKKTVPLGVALQAVRGAGYRLARVAAPGVVEDRNG